MPEYQGSRNKAHVHSGNTLHADGSFTTYIFRSYTGSGIISKVAETINGAINTVGSNFGSGTWSFNFANKWTGNTSANGGDTSKPATIAIMWILRFI